MSDKPATITAHLISIPLQLGASLFNAYVLTQWWAWFVVPLGAPALSWLHAYGLCAVGFFFWRNPALAIVERAETLPKYSTSSYTIAKPIILAATGGLVWAFSYLVYRLM